MSAKFPIKLDGRRKLIALALFIFLLISVGLKMYFPPVNGLLLNIITELGGAFIVFLVVDGSINRMEEDKKARLKSVAIRSLKQPIWRYIWAWLHVSDGEENAKKALENKSIEEYITSNEFIDKVQRRSFNDPFTTSAILGEDRPFKDKFPEIINKFKNDINDAIKTYAYSLDSNDIAILQHFAHDAHLYNNIRLRNSIQTTDNQWFVDINAENIREHFDNFCKLLQLYNDNVNSDNKLTNKNVMTLSRVTGKVDNVSW